MKDALKESTAKLIKGNENEVKKLIQEAIGQGSSARDDLNNG
ncbi:MAG: hypothetical protein PVF26_10720 [Desulfobacterales bacterium]|jgi:hypothetical protein